MECFSEFPQCVVGYFLLQLQFIIHKNDEKVCCGSRLKKINLSASYLICSQAIETALSYQIGSFSKGNS